MSRENVVVLVRGAIMAALFITLWAWLASLVRRFDASIPLSLPAWVAPIGWIIAVAGFAIGLTCVVLFLTTGRGTPAPFDPPKVFVATGPYRYVRNPMYVGAVLALTGAGLALQSISIVALAIVFWTLSHLMVLLNEEPSLDKRFGDSYLDYKRKVNRWLPWPPESIVKGE